MKKEKIMPIVTIVLAVLCVAGFVTYSISRSMLLDTKEKVNNLKLNVKVTQATNDEIEPTVVVETVNPKIILRISSRNLTVKYSHILSINQI